MFQRWISEELINLEIICKKYISDDLFLKKFFRPRQHTGTGVLRTHHIQDDHLRDYSCLPYPEIVSLSALITCNAVS